MTGVFGGRLFARLFVLALCISLSTFASYANAELLVYEPFDYPVGGGLSGLNGGTGFTGPWRDETTVGSAVIQSGSIPYPGLGTSGNSVLMSAQTGTYNIWRNFANVEGADGATTWLGFLGQRLGPAQEPPANPNNPYPRGVNVSFYNTEDDDTATTERFAIGNSSGAATNNWAFIGRGSGTNILPAANPPAPFGGAPPAWVVVRIDHHGPPNVNGPGNNDDVYFFVNPDPTIEPPLAGANAQRLGTEPNAFDYSGLDHLRPFIGGQDSRPYGELLLDELRIGTTYSDIAGQTTVPTLPGDTDSDGTPGEFPDDFEPIRANFRKAVELRTEGDLVKDGIVNFRDFEEWKTAFLGQGGSLADVGLSFSSNVPEPTSYYLAILTLTALARITARRRPN